MKGYKINKFASVSPNVRIRGKFEMGAGCLQLSISKGLKVGKSSIIGANSFVNRDVPTKVIKSSI